MKFSGLNTAQVIANREKYGTNKMPEPARVSAWGFLVDVFHDKINLILLVMCAMFATLAMFGYGDITEAVGIAIVLVIVAIVNVITKLNSQRRTLELRQRASQLFSNVMRSGHVVNIDSSEIVVGDIVILQAGETIPADGYVVHGQIAVNNSILNGESAEVHKSPVANFKCNRNLPITADNYIDKNHIFAGTTVQSGECVMRVTRVGLDTENAKILHTLNHITETKTSLQKQLDKLAGQIGRIGSACAGFICIIMFIMHVYNNGIGDFGDTLYAAINIITISLTIFVAAVPEGLPFIISIITGQNVRKMIRANILAKNPHKIPQAGNIQLLCTDKTGTITRGILTPVANYLGDGTNIGFDTSDSGGAIGEFMRNIILNGRAMLDDNNHIVGGNSTERAIFGAINPGRTSINAIRRAHHILARTPFNSAHKFSSTTVHYGAHQRTYFMAAPEIILAHAKFYIDSDGNTHPVRRGLIQRLIKYNAHRAMRVIATAYYDGKITNGKIPDKLVFVSLTTMRDEIRPGVNDVVRDLRTSGVQIMMITGDILDTARVIAMDCGIMATEQDIAITASEFDTMSDVRARKLLPKISVIARATPQTKLRVVQLAQSRGLSIGMCGDGTNDAPALKGADIGFAMGDSTDVCKAASDIIITDNNFISIANSILMGRTFMHNVSNFLKFQLPINFMLVTVSILFPLFVGIEAMYAVQILIINIVIDSLNSLAFGGEPARPEYMSEPAHGHKTPLITKNMMENIAWTTLAGVFIFALTLTQPFQNIFNTPGEYLSGRFALLIFIAMFNGFCVRARRFNIFNGLSKNPMFIGVALFVFAGTFLCVTFGGATLQMMPLNITQWGTLIIMGAMIIPINMLYRAIRGKSDL